MQSQAAARIAGKEKIMIELTEQQQRELKAAGWPARVLNPATQETFVLMPAGMFERAWAFLRQEDELDAVEEMCPLVNEALDEGEVEQARGETA